MKGCSTSYATRELQVKTIMRYHYIPIRMTKTRNTDDTKCWKRCGATGTLIYHCWEYKMLQPFWKTFGILAISYKATHILTNNPVIVILGIHPKQLKTSIHTKTYT